MDSRELFHATLAGIKCIRPPFWMMRQAGRYLPEYRQLKAEHGFLGLVKNPELSLEVALQPMRRFDFDCAILFSDILVVSEALGLPYTFKDGGGIMLEKTILSESDIDKLPPAEIVREKLSYVSQSLKLLRKALPQKALLGFSASPFTLASYMVEGGSSADGFSKFKNFRNENPLAFAKLMDKLALVIQEYASMQMECGIDAIQLFDSNAQYIEADKYESLSGRWLAQILENIGGRMRTIVYAKGMSNRFAELAPMGADAYSLDSSARLSHIMLTWKAPYALQGNLDEKLLSDANPEKVRAETLKILDDMSPLGRHIFNLGHGILPDAKIENVEAMCEVVKNYGTK